MKNATILFPFLLALTYNVFAQQTKIAGKVTADQLISQVQSNKAYLVDVRSPEEFKAGHLKYAINISYNETDFSSNIEKLNKGKSIYFYSNTGKRSAKAAEKVKTLGFSDAHDAGGLADLKNIGLQME